MDRAPRGPSSYMNVPSPLTRKLRMRRSLLRAIAIAALPSALAAQQPDSAAPAPPAPAVRPALPADALTLSHAIELAQGQGLAGVSARNARDVARWRDRAFNERLRPQLSLTGNAADLNRGFTPITLTNGQTQFVRQSQNQSWLGLQVAQRLPWTGGTFTVGSQLTRVDLFGEQGNSQLWLSTPLTLGLQQDLFRPREFVWDEREQSVRAGLAEQQYLEAREEVASTAASAYFDLYAAQKALDNATANAAVNDTLYTLNKGRYEVGKIGENDLLQSELALLRARASVDQARLDRDHAEAALRRLLGLRGADPITLDPPTLPAVITVDTAVAVAEALRNSSVIDQTELNQVQAKRRATEARYNNTFGATVTAQYGYNQTAPVFNQAYQSLLDRQRLTVGVSMPLWQWGAGHADVEGARAAEKQVEADALAARQKLEEDARFAARQLVQAQRMLLISAKADTVADKRFEVAKNRYVIGKIGISDLYIAQSEKDAAVLAFVQALRGYWASYYGLRRVTLYDFDAGKEIAP